MINEDRFVEDYFNEGEDDILDGVEYDEELEFDEALYRKNLEENSFPFRSESEGIGE